MGFVKPSVGFCLEGVISPSLAIRKGFIFIESRDIFRVAIMATLMHFDNFPDLKLEPEIFIENDVSKIESLNREISIRRKKISEVIVANFPYNLTNGHKIIDPSAEILYQNREKLYALNKIIRESISPMLALGDYVIHGKNIPLDFPSSYEISTKPDDDVSSLLERAIQKKEKYAAIESVQKQSAIDRNQFVYKTNSFLVPIRQALQERIREEVVKHHEVFGEFDLSMQLLMHLGAYKIEDIWNIGGNDLERLHYTDNAFDCCEEFEALINEKRISLNDKLISNEINRLADELTVYLKGLSIQSDNCVIELPSKRMSNQKYTPFSISNNRAELVLSEKEFYDSPEGKIMIVREKYSGKKVIFSPIPSEISLLYSLGFCNLHYANAGEITAYGAFVEGDNLPFAYSSYGQISYNYTKEMLAFLGFKNNAIVESSRAWNAAWAPENTMSVLFSYSHECLKEKYGDEIKGVLTSINPNLGFSASAFRGIHFEIVALKPTVFSYQVSNEGKYYFHSKNEIANILGLEVSSLSKSQYYTENKIPFLPTVEFIYLFDKNERKKLLKSPIYVVSEYDYLNNR